jgi:hypothetical protein
MREEKEAWDVIVTDMQGSGGSGQAGQGENKVAVAGVGGDGTSTGPRGGSTRTLQEIMDAIKNGGVAGGNGQSPAPGSPSGQGSSQGQAPSGMADGSGQASDGQGTQVADAGSATGGSAADGAGQSDGSQGDASASGGGSGDQAGDAGDSNAQSEAGRTAEPLSPLERMRKSQDERPARGTQRSASDYLGTGSGD